MTTTRKHWRRRRRWKRHLSATTLRSPTFHHSSDLSWGFGPVSGCFSCLQLQLDCLWPPLWEVLVHVSPAGLQLTMWPYDHVTVWPCDLMTGGFALDHYDQEQPIRPAVLTCWDSSSGSEQTSQSLKDRWFVPHTYICVVICASSGAVYSPCHMSRTIVMRWWAFSRQCF